MNIQQLRYFLAMMETGSVSRAAELSSVTQPTLSVALKRLEDELGVRLFVPDGRGVRALPAAERLERHVRVAMRALSDARRELTQSAGRPLRIGLLPSLAPLWLPALIKAWDSRPQVTEASAGELTYGLAHGRLDLALTAMGGRLDGHHRVVLREPYRLFVGLAHEFAGQRRVSIGDLQEQPFVLRECCELLGKGRRLLQVAGVRLKVVARTQQETTAEALVSADAGVTLAPSSWGGPGVRAVEVSGFALERVIAVVWKAKEVNKAATAIATRLEAQLAGLRKRS